MIYYAVYNRHGNCEVFTPNYKEAYKMFEITSVVSKYAYLIKWEGIEARELAHSVNHNIIFNNKGE